MLLLLKNLYHGEHRGTQGKSRTLHATGKNFPHDSRRIPPSRTRGGRSVTSMVKRFGLNNPVTTEGTEEHRGNQGPYMPQEKTFHMTPDEFRRHGHAVVDWIADYYARIESYPVLSRAMPGQIRDSLPAKPPAKGETFDAILGDIEKLIVPGITHWQSPNFFAFFCSNSSGPSILGDLLSSGLGVQGMLWATSPACTELETHVLDWLVGMLGLDRKSV